MLNKTINKDLMTFSVIQIKSCSEERPKIKFLQLMARFGESNPLLWKFMTLSEFLIIYIPSRSFEVGAIIYFSAFLRLWHILFWLILAKFKERKKLFKLDRSFLVKRSKILQKFLYQVRKALKNYKTKSTKTLKIPKSIKK